MSASNTLTAMVLNLSLIIVASWLLSIPIGKYVLLKNACLFLFLQ